MLDDLRKFLGVHSLSIEIGLPIGLFTWWMVHEYNYRMIPYENTWYKKNIGDFFHNSTPNPLYKPRRQKMVRVPYYVENGPRSYTDYRYEWIFDSRDAY